MRLQKLLTLNVITLNSKTHLLTSPPLQPLVVFIFALLQTILTKTLQLVCLSVFVKEVRAKNHITSWKLSGDVEVTLTFYFWRLNLHFKDHKGGVGLSSWTKRVSIRNFCLLQSLFSGIIQKPMGYHWLFVKGTRAMLTSELAYKNISSLLHTIIHQIYLIK